MPDYQEPNFTNELTTILPDVTSALKTQEADHQGEPAPAPSFLEFLQKTLKWELDPWQADHLAPLLLEAATGRGKRLLVHAPPQAGKSVILSRRLPAWLLGMDPLRRIVIAGYSENHSATQFGEPLLHLMRDGRYVEMFPSARCRVPAAGSSASAFSTAARLRMLDGQDSVVTVGLLSGFTGKGVGPGDLLIVDDPYASPDDARSAAVNERVWRWWTELAEPRVHPEANVIVMFHRYHTNDLAGRLMERDGFRPVERVPDEMPPSPAPVSSGAGEWGRQEG